MKSHPRLAGLILLLASMVFFLTLDLDKGGGVLGLCGFLFCFVSGFLVVIFFWNDGDISKLRRIHRQMPQRRAVPGISDLEKTFRYPSMKGARLFVMICLCVFMAAMALISLYLLIMIERPADAATIEVLFFMFGLFSACAIFFGWLTWRYARWRIKVDAKGISAITYFGMRQADWQDIVALRDWIPFRGLGGVSHFFAAGFTLYKVYTRSHMISFSSSLSGANELAGLISDATGLDWT